MADALGSSSRRRILHGATAISAQGLDTYGSRSLAAGGVAVQKAAEKIIAKARKIAAHELEVAEEDVEFAEGMLRVRGAPDRAKTVPEVAFSAFLAHNLPDGVEPGLEESATFDPVNNTFPSGAHVCVVEVDTETGLARIVKYVAVDDCGTIVNPMIVQGMVHGGVAQGIAEGLYEEATYDENGTLLTGNMSSYRPSAATASSHRPRLTVHSNRGVKGGGEAGPSAPRGGRQAGRRAFPAGVTASDAGDPGAGLAGHPCREVEGRPRLIVETAKEVWG